MFFFCQKCPIFLYNRTIEKKNGVGVDLEIIAVVSKSSPSQLDVFFFRSYAIIKYRGVLNCFFFQKVRSFQYCKLT